MSAPAELRDGPYSKLIEEDGAYENLHPGLRGRDSPSSSSSGPSAAQRGPVLSLGPGPGRGPVLSLGPGPGRGPGLFRAATVGLAVLCLILLVCLIAVSSRKQSPADGGAELEPQNQKQKQEVNVTELQSVISRLQEENKKLREELNATKVLPPAPPRSCPVDWLTFNGSCYLVSRRSRSWSDSQEFCVSQGGHLAIVTTAEEQTFVWEQLPRGHWNAYWIGITDGHTEDEWKWVDGTPLVGAGFWEEGEPNNHINEDCGYIVKTEVLERVAVRSWYDAPCSMYWPFVCERGPPEAPAPEAPAPTARSG